MSIFLGPPASRRHKGWFERGYLPHFDGGAVVQAITFRLADSLPREVYKHVLSLAEDGERQGLMHRLIDEGRGCCLLRTPENAAIVANALRFFDGERYKLLAWVIMPNHVHAMVEQIEGHRLDRIVHSWKSFTAKQINRRLDSDGRVWARDYFDRYVRDERHYFNALYYIENNPVKAGLVRLAEDWAYSSAAGRLK
ncbi:MAG TPA: transposase [Rhizomicrobium sp.]|nr:transposase [Rhizomicrobium sp.]